MFNLKITAGDGGRDAEMFATELSDIIVKSTGRSPVGGLFRL